MTTHEVLVAARNAIDRYGWCQGSDGYGSQTGPFCTFGACYVAEGDSLFAAHDALQAALRQEYGWAFSDVVAWNDAPGRTKEEVLAIFDKAIAATAPEPADPFTGGLSGVEQSLERALS